MSAVAATTAELAARFVEPDPVYGPVPIWWWSGAPLSSERLREQMVSLLAGGVHQAVVMGLAPSGPLYGSLADEPPFFSEPWWEIFLGACRDAAEIGFHLWLYDQLGFSGANLQGRLVAADPRRAGYSLGRTEVTVVDGRRAELEAPVGATPIAAYAVAAAGADGVATGGAAVPVPVVDGIASWDGGPGRLVLVHSVRRGFDYYDPDACAALLDSVLGEYQRRAGSWFGSVVVGLFQDELPDMPGWGADFAASFTAEYGYDLTTRLWALWEGEGDSEVGVRRDYHAHRARLAKRAFFDPQTAWTARHGLVAGFDQQSPAREGDPLGGVRTYGDYLSTHDGYSAPGSDHWGDPRVHASLAHAYGHPRTWIEAFHSSGWGGTIEETYDWLSAFLRRGATLYDPHAVYYSTAGGWWEWAPPSTCWRQPYWDTYPVFSGAVSRLCALLSAGSHVCDTVLLHPTSTAQGNSTLDGPLPAGESSDRLYHELNGTPTWFSEKQGVLDGSGHDWDVLDEASLASGTVQDGVLSVAAERFRNVVLPGATVLDGRLAGRLADLAASGGRVVCVGAVPRLFPGGDAGADAGADGSPGGPQRFRAAVRAGSIRVVDQASEVPALLVDAPVRVAADAPLVIRRVGESLVLVLTAHDELTGSAQPLLPLLGGRTALDGIDFGKYCEALQDGYVFTPVGDRSLRVRVEGLPAGYRAQQWDPRSGARTDVPLTTEESGALVLNSAFADGTVAVVVLAPDLPPATRRAPGAAGEPVPVAGPWTVQALPSLDNSRGDFAGADVASPIPLQVWRLEAATEVPDAPDWGPVTATVGTWAEVRGALDGPWRPAQWSLSRGIPHDPLHARTLGPKGMVPEEFLHWSAVPPGGVVGVRTRLPLLDGPLWLAVGSAAQRSVSLDGKPAVVDGTGYWTFTPLPQRHDGADGADGDAGVGRPGGYIEVEVEFAPDGAGDLRASFAVVSDPARFTRPEWLTTAGDGQPGPRDEGDPQRSRRPWSPPAMTGTASTAVLEVRRTLEIAAVPGDATLQVGSEGACTVLVNGHDVGRQGGFDPYLASRSFRIAPYDVGPFLRPGLNEVVVRAVPVGGRAAVFIDSPAIVDGGLGVVSNLSWSAFRDGVAVPAVLRREQVLDPRWTCLWARPHPLPRAAWLDPAAASGGVVADVVPDPFERGPRTELLRFPAPVGTTGFTVASTVPFTAVIEGIEISPDADGSVMVPPALTVPLATGTPVLLRFSVTGGESGGGLLDGPVTVHTAPARAPLVAWSDLGLRALGGSVAYRTEFDLPDGPLHDPDAGTVADSDDMVLDLGEVRGAATVRVNGVDAGALAWSPYRIGIGGLVHPGTNALEVVVRGTLAGYLEDSSPTPFIAPNQIRTGLFGPVRLIPHDAPGVTGEATPG